MTGMPASLAAWTPGRTAWLSCAKQDQDIDVLVDERLDVGQLLLGVEIRVGVGVGAAARLDRLLDVRLVLGRPARLLEVVPGDATEQSPRRL